MKHILLWVSGVNLMCAIVFGLTILVLPVSSPFVQHYTISLPLGQLLCAVKRLGPGSTIIVCLPDGGSVPAGATPPTKPSFEPTLPPWKSGDGHEL
mgnify:CR=1 FL=1